MSTLRLRPAVAAVAHHPTLRSFEYWVYQYRRTWRSGVITGFLSPVLFLAAMGLGLGSLVHTGSAGPAGLQGVAYLVFLAPGLLAANAMQVGVQESTYPVMGAIKWIRTYFGMLATPLRVVDVMLGHLLFIALRILSVSAIFLVVMAAFGTTKSWMALLALPAALLTGVAFATPVMAYAATQEDDAGFNFVFRFVVMPLFLLSGTFFPVDQLPPLARYIAYASPLWQGVDLCRTLDLGIAQFWPTLGHVVYLTVLAVGGAVVALRTFSSRLET
jgi:lipooligosaccharide transport system permease protein